ncbi:MAG: DUF1499 domain-containing protein [Gemmobacter sp.]
MLALSLGILALLGLMAWVRLAPVDPARWHVAVAVGADPQPGPCTVVAEAGSARTSCLLPLSPAEVLARLDTIALATPRTRRVAGNAEEGRITWETRSALWGFPDYTTAEARDLGDGTRLDVLARLRFGGYDLGVNAARLRGWLSRLAAA